MSESAVAQPSVEDKMKNEPVGDTGMDNEVQMGGVETVPQEINEGVVSQKRNGKSSRSGLKERSRSGSRLR